MTGRLVVMASGAGTNLGAILDAIAEGRLDAAVTAVIINRRGAGARLRAERAGVPVHYRPLAPYRRQARHTTGREPPPATVSGDWDWDATLDRRHYDADLAELVASTEPDLVVLAGWMHLLSSAFLERFPNRVINLHPALPGEFPGSDAIADAWEAFEAGRISRTGVMVHFVPDEGVDNGPLIAAAEVPIHASDTCDVLRRRIHEIEHDLIVSAVAQVLSTQPLAPTGFRP
ncbi:MAG: phosphoribosylglycinamide formyltransferase [Acidimicrobiia bacterium]|nr:phosphoribosylglycinamide formyltransferase [Acidimicrobiia bacterium]